jgi:sugar-phosphatase
MHRAALFDLDGTLIDTEPRSRQAWTHLFVRHGVPCDDTVLASFAGRPAKEALTDHLPAFPGYTVEELAAEALSYTALPDMPPVVPVRGALELLRTLSARGVPLALVTSGTRVYAHGELTAIDAEHFFDVIVTADDVTRGKPDPQGYLHACAALGVHPSHSVVFEDAPAGVTAAKSAGAYCVALTTTQPAAALAAADLVVPHLDAVRWPPTAVALPQETRR